MKDKLHDILHLLLSLEKNMTIQGRMDMENRLIIKKINEKVNSIILEKEYGRQS